MNKTATDLKIIDQIIREHGTGQEAVIPILQGIQKHYRYLPQKALQQVCELTDITPAMISGVSTFYSQFRHTPVGKHGIHVCIGTACHVKGAGRVYDAFKRHLHIPEHDDTDAARNYTLHEVACLGCCTLAPVVQIDDVTFGHVQPDTVGDILADFNRFAGKSKHTTKPKPMLNTRGAVIRLGLGSCCIAGGSDEVREAVQRTLHDRNIPAGVKRVGCVGMCHQTPLMEIIIPGQEPVLYTQVHAGDVSEILGRHFRPRGFQVVTAKMDTWLQSLITDKGNDDIPHYPAEVRDGPIQSFLGMQVHIATEHSGAIDPIDLDEYKQKQGFQALQDCLQNNDREAIINKIKDSGLRGRGGGGFPTWKKWDLVRNAGDNNKIIICNGDEGDPGAFMDRMLLESYPYRIIEGMIIAAYTVGANKGFLYIRAEYPLAVKRVQQALAICRDAGYLGDNILNSGFSLDLQVWQGAGAFVCGEETALIASIEGKRGMPRIRPPYPAAQGLWQQPTLVNNVETLSKVAWILRQPDNGFARLGTESSKGTKVFALAGKINRGGLIEVPMGITIRQIVEDIGGGIQNGRQFKAVQIGGPSGGCIPASMADSSIDFEELTKAGAMMGSGGLLVMDDTDCMVDIARYFLSFTQDQSCGKCTFCRVGTRRMLDILERICNGKGTEKDLTDLESLAEQTRAVSLCGLGRSAPNPVLTTLRYFRDEYIAHLQGHCPASKCPGLVTYSITDDCIGCTKCARDCPVDAITFQPYKKHSIDTDACIKCDTCRQVCPVNAVVVN